ncbi:MAG: hypothetical protein R3B70_47775, partial [Polyangiaceae bacterium]
HRLSLHEDGGAAGDPMIRRLREVGLDPVRFVPILSVWLSVRLPPGFSPPQMAPYRQRELLLEATAALLARPAGDKGPVILFEDLHWSDPTTLDLIDRLLSADSASPPYLLCTTRPAPAPRLHGENLTRVDLDRLSPADAEALARHVFRSVPVAAAGTWELPVATDPARSGIRDDLPDDVAAAIIARADGVPLFIEEITRTIAERGLRKLDVHTIPITLRDSLFGRLDALGDARRIAQIAAALGRELDGALLVATTGGDDLAVQKSLDRLIDQQIVYRRRWLAGSTFVFRHALLQEAAYESMPREVRRQVHAQVIEVLQHQFTTSPLCTPAVLARHHAGAGQFDAAVRRGTEAAQSSLDRSSNAEAIAEVEQTTSWLTDLPEPARPDAELRLTSIKLQALMSKEGWASENVRALAQRSRGLLAQTTEARTAFAILFGLFLYYRVSSQHVATRRITDELVEQAERTGDPSLRCIAATAKGATYYGDTRFREAEVWLERALESYDPARDQKHGSQLGMDARAWAAALLALVQWGMGRTRRAFQLADEAIDWARQLAHIPSLAIALLYASQIHHMNGDKPRVRALTAELLEWSRTYGLPALEGFGAVLFCWAEGDIQGIRAEIDRLLALNCNLKLTYYGSPLVDLEIEAGRHKHRPSPRSTSG